MTRDVGSERGGVEAGMRVGSSSPHRRADGSSTAAGGPASGDRTGRSGSDAGPTRASTRVRPVAAGIVVALVVGAVAMLGSDSRTSVVVASQWGATTTAPDAPAHQVARRWEWTAGPRAVLAGVGVVGDLVITQTIPRFAGQAGRNSTVTALSMATGEVEWSTDVAMSRPGGQRSLVVAPTVHVVAEREATTLTRALAWLPEGHSTALDAATGGILWQRDFPLGEVVSSGGQLLAAGTQVSPPASDGAQTAASAPGEDEAQTVTGHVVDLHDGTDVFARPGDVVATRNGWAVRSLAGDTHRTTLVHFDGTPIVTTRAEALPAVAGDLVLVAEGTEVSAYDDDGTRLWRVAIAAPDLDRRDDLDSQRFTSLVSLGDHGVLAAVHMFRSMGTDVGTALTRIDLDGTATPVASTPLESLLLHQGIVTVDIDGRTRIVCTEEPGLPTDGGPSCPDDLAVLDGDGRVLDAVAVDGGLRQHLVVEGPLGGLATTAGLVVGEDNAVVLRGWDDLAPLWTVSVDGRIADDITVATSERGVAIGIRSPHPGTVTWLS